MRESLSRTAGGFTLVAVLVMVVVLSLLGTVAMRTVAGDVRHSGKDSRRVRAEYAAESAVQWALSEIGRRRSDQMPYTLATHKEDGVTPMGRRQAGISPTSETARLEISDLAAFPGAGIERDREGWIELQGWDRSHNLSGAEDEVLAFKAWYPNDSTLRITGRAVVNGSQARIELVSTLRISVFPY